MSVLNVLFGNYSKRELKRIQPIVTKVLALEDEFKALSDSDSKTEGAFGKGRNFG